jgi:site-specific DNA recombinase
VLLLEELARVGVDVCFAKEPERGGTPGDELLRQFQGMIAEYERAQIAERHPTREAAPRAQRLAGGDVRRVLRIPLRQEETDHCDAYWEIDELEAQTLRDVFARYAQDATSIGELACWLTERGVPTRTGKTVWDRSTIWAMLRNPAYRGQGRVREDQDRRAARRADAHHPRPGRAPRPPAHRHDQPPESWTLVAVPAIVSEETFELAQVRLVENARFSRRNTKELTLLQGVLVCRECGYFRYRTYTRTSNKRISSTSASAGTAGGTSAGASAQSARSAPTSSSGG